VVEAMLPYVERELARGTRLSHMTRHMLGLIHGHPGARTWRRILTVGAVAPGAGLEVVRDALESVTNRPPASAETVAAALAFA
jgi:tRNA-dihydrouridine synthase A